MQLPKIKCYTAGTEGNVFYVLCKGLNAGKPLRQPCPNCFTVQCTTADQAEHWFMLSWGLWKAQKFHILLTGSVIPFIRIGDYRQLLRETGTLAAHQPEQWLQKLKTMQEIEKCEQAVREKLALLGQMKITVFNSLLRPS